LERQQARELEQAYEKLRGAQQQLVRSKQLAAIGEMAAIVAHEIRNPLSTIGGFARLLQRHPSDAERVKRNSRIIREEVERLERILEDLLELSRPEELKIEECDVGGLVCDVAEMARSDPKATQIEIRTDVEDDVPRVPADPALVREVMVNLIRNGLEAMHAGGTLTLRARRTENGAAIDVSDTGEGIPPERLDTIFEAFVTTKPTGTGLGLARSRKIIEQHGAKLTVESQPGVGSTFSIFFPKDALPPVTAAGADGADTGQGD
jgi:signal transduction histidine kinase